MKQTSRKAALTLAEKGATLPQVLRAIQEGRYIDAARMISLIGAARPSTFTDIEIIGAALQVNELTAERDVLQERCELLARANLRLTSRIETLRSQVRVLTDWQREAQASLKRTSGRRR